MKNMIWPPVMLIALLSCCGTLLAADEKNHIHLMAWKHGRKLVDTTVQVGPGFTTVFQQKNVFFINYRNGKLYNQDKRSGKCTCFSFLSDVVLGQDLDQRTFSQRAALFAEIEVYPAEEKGWTTVLYGSTAGRLKTIVPPTLEIYGVTFSPGRVDYKVVPEAQVDSELRAIARLNEEQYGRNPLLRQIDVLGLLPYLGGLPVEARTAEAVVRYRYDLMGREKLLGQIPAAGCKQVRD